MKEDFRRSISYVLTLLSPVECVLFLNRYKQSFAPVIVVRLFLRVDANVKYFIIIVSNRCLRRYSVKREEYLSDISSVFRSVSNPAFTSCLQSNLHSFVDENNQLKPLLVYRKESSAWIFQIYIKFEIEYLI